MYIQHIFVCGIDYEEKKICCVIDIFLCRFCKDSQMSRETSGVLDIYLHPLVVVSIADHYTRAKVRHSVERVYGVLLGRQEWRRVELFSSFEVPLATGHLLDTAYLEEKSKAVKQVSPGYEIMGWYSTGREVEEEDMAIQKQLERFNESPLFLCLDPNLEVGIREVPIEIYESKIKVVRDQPVSQFVKVPYKIETEDIERLSIDCVARTTSVGGGSQIQMHLASMHQAVSMLQMRVMAIASYLKVVEDGELEADQAILRHIFSLCRMLQTTNDFKIARELSDQYNDVLLLTFIASTVKASSLMHGLIEKFNKGYDRRPKRRTIA
ncbi:COP9 signalosome complex subunit 6-like [Schistocerca gregaria]|uniref:COP9 signalosome complex subunit 6-like n=1 Tax=Schistocerca gregaria TaxID=7010 RepID=UPI00211DF412|nr:COP9 signalosome complex subunit 6-like [Schistocerca gregaria]XP_049849967.1 COP9 signalosome complex subunit 6-like [Schistocerca gregaria]XP_049849968.1 COP9 signalosome complex subunit 6-like [Schistocerca gregaria]